MAIALVSAALMASAAPAAFSASPPVMVLGLQQEVAPDAPVPAQDMDAPQADSLADQENALEAEQEPATENVIIVKAASQGRLIDPLVKVNEAAFKLTQSVDAAFVAPIAKIYEEDLPSPIRKGLRNFLRNLMEPVNALNYLLQLKPGKAIETLGRFTINTTVGVGGLFDVAKRDPINLPYRRNGFSNTLGYYGVGPGPFLVLPLVGATTLRDLIGSGLDQSVLPFAVGKPFNTPYYAIPAYTVNSLEFRIEFDERIEQINTSDDPYYAMRESYLCLREADIAALKNRPPPRDCSIDSLMAGPPEAGSVAALPQEPGAVEMATIEEAAEAEAVVEPVMPEIIYISREVVQPITAN